MTRKHSIITGCGVGDTESFVVEDYHQEYLFKSSSALRRDLFFVNGDSTVVYLTRLTHTTGLAVS